MASETAAQEDPLQADKEALVSRFASQLGSESTPRSVGTHALLVQCLAASIGDTTVVCKLPSFDLQQPEAADSGGGVSSSSAGDVPVMAASVLSQETNRGPAEASADAALLEQAAARNLGSPTTWTRSSLIHAPNAVLRSISASFQSLVDSRVRAWTLLLLRHSLSSGDAGSRGRLLNLLAASSSIELGHVKTNFKTLPLPPQARAHKKEAEVILPLILEAVMDVSIQGKNDSVPLRAPGTIAANFVESTDGPAPLLKWVEISLDTHALVSSMVEQARLVVFRAVARATSSPATTPGHAYTRPVPAESLSKLSSALNVSSHAAGAMEENAKLQKANSSALRLNSILHGKEASSATEANPLPLSKNRKNRSVTWEHPMQHPSKDATNWPTAKRQRKVVQSSLLRSTRSFGKPDSTVFESVRNATFAEFGGRSPAAPTFVRGKLRVPSRSAQGHAKGEDQSSNQNATFDPIGLDALACLNNGASFRTESWSVGSCEAGAALPAIAKELESLLVSGTTAGGGVSPASSMTTSTCTSR